MDIQQIAERFDMVKWQGGGFTARCPAHNDKSPSLTVRRGMKGILVKCQVGCSFFEVVAAAHMTPIDFKYESFTSASPNFFDKTGDVMRGLTGEEPTPKTIEGVLEAAGLADDDRINEVFERYPEFIGLSFEDAMKMQVIFFAGPMWDLVGDEYGKYGHDWPATVDEIADRMWRTWRTGKPGRDTSR